MILLSVITAASVRSQYIYGNGTTGLKREAYFAGWVLVGELEKRGMSLAQLSRLSQAEIEKLLFATIAILQTK